MALRAWERRRGARERAGLAFDRQLGVARPLVPRAGVVPRAVAGGPEREGRTRGARARVAVRDDVGSVGEIDCRTHLLRSSRLPRVVEEGVEVDAARAGNVPLAGVTRVAAAPGVLLGRPDVENRKRAV